VQTLTGDRTSGGLASGWSARRLAELAGAEVRLGARIIAVADVVEAMTSHRPYRPSRGFDEALNQIEHDRGSLLDAEAVDACLRLFRHERFSFERR
jgi:HD-GYP domain-containing protein (c-di-GMP phosphodiesterase class II)